MSVRQAAANSDVDERMAALITNAAAVKAVSSAVEGTIGPKGLDSMLVDKFGEVIISNDGCTILEKMEVNHPAARMLIKIARAQQDEIGDGTTTATIIAGALVAEGVGQVSKGVPVVKVIEGIRAGIRNAVEYIDSSSTKLEGLSDPALMKVAMVAGRQNPDIAELAVKAAGLVGEDKLLEKGFRLSDTIIAKVGAENEVFSGVIIDRKRLNIDMPKRIENAALLVIDDALEPEEIEDEALGTESGFARYMELQEQFKLSVNHIIEAGARVVVVDRGVNDYAEEVLTEAGVLVISRVSNKQLRKVAEHTGARALKRNGLRRNPDELRKFMGKAALVYEDDKLEHVRIIGGQGKPMATILVGAATEEIMGERERITEDAASSVQAAVKSGLAAGGGAVEIAAMRSVAKMRQGIRGMMAYGVDCVIEALKRPISQIVINAGFNSLEKVEDVIVAQTESGNGRLAIDCDSGEVADMFELGVVDPALVKIHAIKAAGEVAEAILRIDRIIKKRDDGDGI